MTAAINRTKKTKANIPWTIFCSASIASESAMTYRGFLVMILEIVVCSALSPSAITLVAMSYIQIHKKRTNRRKLQNTFVAVTETVESVFNLSPEKKQLRHTVIVFQ
jgi:hypothetical protein